MHFANYASEVIMLVRGDSFRGSMSQYLCSRVQQHAKIKVLFNTSVSALDGDDQLHSITLKNHQNNTTEQYEARRLFVAIGGRPHTEWAKDTPIIRDQAGYLVTGPDLIQGNQLPSGWPLDRQPYYLETSVPGSFAAGDVRHNSVKRAATAAGEGAMAITITFVHRYLREDFENINKPAS